MASSTTTAFVILLLVATSSMMVSSSQVRAARAIPQSYTGVEPGVQFELLAAKRGDGYGWNDCEFSPLSCLLKRRRRRSTQ